MVQRQTFSEFDIDALFETHAALLRRENQVLRRRRNLALVFLTPLFFCVALPVTLLGAILILGLEAPLLSLPMIWHGIHTLQQAQCGLARQCLASATPASDTPSA